MDILKNYLLLEFQQENYTVRVGLFADEEEAETFLKQIPGYMYEQPDSDFAKMRFLDPDRLPSYLEVPFGGALYPLTCYMFEPGVRVDIELYPLPLWPATGLHRENEPVTGSNTVAAGWPEHRPLVSGATRVDAYVVPNDELAAYLTKREQVYQRLEERAAKSGIKLERAWRGSEDGEAVMWRTADGNNHFLTHMDPPFVEMADLPAAAFETWWQELIDPTSV